MKSSLQLLTHLNVLRAHRIITPYRKPITRLHAQTPQGGDTSIKNTLLSLGAGAVARDSEGNLYSTGRATAACGFCCSDHRHWKHET